MRHSILFAFVFLWTAAIGQNNLSPLQQLAFESIQGYSAFETTAYVEIYWRLAGNPGFDSSIFHVVRKLENAGFQEESVATGRLTYRIEKRELKQPSWTPLGGLLFLEGDDQPILSFENNRNMIAVNSFPTKGLEEFELVRIENTENIADLDLKGKVVFTESSIYRIYKQVILEGGARGVISYGMPDYLQPERNRESIQFGGIPYDDNIPAFGLALSTEARDKLVKYLDSGKNKVRINVSSHFTRAPELTVVASINGSEFPEKELVVSCHVQEPGANDNASGVGAGIELAETFAKLVIYNQLELKRTVTFLWGDEISSTRRYVSEDYPQKRETLWGISLDMVGEKTSITGGKFLLEKMPDPSAIWTRGQDQHTEWGASQLKIDDLFPHYFNDFALNRMNEVGKHYDWEVSYNPYEGGSDHVPFLRAGIPGILFWHFTDQFYHTDGDRIDKVSRKTLRNVTSGTFIIASTLLNADQDVIRSILLELNTAASTRLLSEFQESRKAISEGSDVKEEKLILNTWLNWYEGAIDSVKDIEELNKPNQKLANSIKKSLRKELEGYLRGL